MVLFLCQRPARQISVTTPLRRALEWRGLYVKKCDPPTLLPATLPAPLERPYAAFAVLSRVGRSTSLKATLKRAPS